MDPLRRLSLTTGILFLLTFVSAIVGVALYGPVLSDPDFVLGSADASAENLVILGALCELVLIAANIGTALALYPVLKRQSPALALGYVAARIVECVFIAVGLLALLTVVTLRQEGAASEPALLVLGQGLVDLRDWTFLLGPGFVVGIGNGLLLGWLLWRSHLVPRPMALIGVIGGPLMTLSGIAVMFGAYEQTSVPSVLFTLPEIVWEASLGIYLVAKGFRPAAVARLAPARELMTSS
jgi:hypothetical protein